MRPNRGLGQQEGQALFLFQGNTISNIGRSTMDYGGIKIHADGDQNLHLEMIHNLASSEPEDGTLGLLL
jgi:hypothetical protein